MNSHFQMIVNTHAFLPCFLSHLEIWWPRSPRHSPALVAILPSLCGSYWFYPRTLWFYRNCFWALSHLPSLVFSILKATNLILLFVEYIVLTILQLQWSLYIIYMAGSWQQKIVRCHQMIDPSLFLSWQATNKRKLHFRTDEILFSFSIYGSQRSYQHWLSVWFLKVLF